ASQGASADAVCNSIISTAHQVLYVLACFYFLPGPLRGALTTGKGIMSSYGNGGGGGGRGSYDRHSDYSSRR
ncbi:unnamed protein product, partial [Pylaiella littoralis]